MTDKIDLDVIEDKATIQTRPSVTGPQLLALVRAVRAALADFEHRTTPLGTVADGVRSVTMEEMEKVYWPQGRVLHAELRAALAPFRKEAGNG